MVTDQIDKPKNELRAPGLGEPLPAGIAQITLCHQHRRIDIGLISVRSIVPEVSRCRIITVKDDDGLRFMLFTGRVNRQGLPATVLTDTSNLSSRLDFLRAQGIDKAGFNRHGL